MDDLRDAVLEALRSSDGQRLHYVYGAQSVGKSALLRSVSDTVVGMLRPVLVSAPLAAPDAAAAAAGRLAGGLYKAGVLREQDLDAFESGQTSWSDKLALIRAVLNDEEAVAGIVLLIDEPRTWRSQIGGPFTEQSEQLSRLLVDGVRVRRVVTTGRRPEQGSHHAVYQLRAGGDHRQWLAAAEHWGALAESALRLADGRSEALATFTPLQVRLSVTLDHLGRQDILDAVTASARLPMAELCDAVVTAIIPEGGALAETLGKLSRVRGSFDDVLLEILKAPDAGTEEGKILRSGLLYGGEGRYVLHDALRVALHRWYPSMSYADVCDLHGQYIEYYARRGEAARQRWDVRGRLSAEVELFWHACQAGVVDADQRYVHRFPIQPLLFGRTMHLGHGRPDVAERVFREVAEVTGSAYAIHHLAFSLDRQAQQPELVESGYREALALDDGSALWHARLILFLLDQGALAEAHAAWQDALRAPLNSDERAESTVNQLHRPVLARLLRIAEVEFAEEIFAELSVETVNADPALRALRTRLVALKEAERNGPVRPYRLLRPEWWKEQPRHLLQEMPDGLTLSHWWAARVDEVDDDGVELQFAEVADGEVRPGNTHVAQELFTRALGGVPFEELRPGVFLEVGFYRNGTPDVSQVVVQRVRTDGTLDDLPPSELPPQRYHASADHDQA